MFLNSGQTTCISLAGLTTKEGEATLLRFRTQQRRTGSTPAPGPFFALAYDKQHWVAIM